MAHFFKELAGTELTLDVKKDALQLLPLLDYLRIFVSGTRRVGLRLLSSVGALGSGVWLSIRS